MAAVAPPPRRHGAWRRPALGAALVAGLLALAWFDGGEKPLRPIAAPVALPEQGR